MEYYLSKMLSAHVEVTRLKEKNASNKAKIKERKEPALEPALEKFFFHTSGVSESIQSLNELVQLLDFFEIEWFEDNKPKFMKLLTNLIDSLPSDASVNCEIIIEIFRRIFENIEPELTEKIKSLNIEENRRLNEAFNCYLNELNYSSIVMGVSTIESRLFSLMHASSNDDKLKDLTLGQLIREYIDNKEKYGHLIPRKHKPLLEYCNTYRVFSVHPKKEKITRSNATTILCMTCAFLFDGNLRLKLREG